MRQLCRWASEPDLLLCPLVNTDQLATLEAMFVEFPNTKIVIDHFGHANADKPAELQSLLRLARHPQVHVKVSGFYKFGDRRAPYDDLAPMIRHTTEAFGPDRLLWGSDCPYQLQAGNNYADAVSLVEHDLEFLDASARRKMLRDTAQRLFFQR